MPNSNEAGADPAFPSNVVIGIAGNPVSSGNPLPITGTVAMTGMTGTLSSPSITQFSDGTTPAQKAAVDAAGGVAVSNRAANAALTNVASVLTSVVVLAANPARKTVIVYNDSTANLKIAFSALASATSFTLLLPPGVAYEPAITSYTGAISGIWDAANGFARVTEVTQ